MTENDDVRRNMLEAVSAFEAAIGRAIQLSDSRLGTMHTGRQNRVLMAFAKAIAHAMSIQRIVDQSIRQRPSFGFLDHFSVGALTRTLIDAAIMTLYLSEPSLNAAHWDLRRHVLFLHDANNRKRFLKVLHKRVGGTLSEGELAAHRKNKDSVVDVIEQRAKELGCQQEQTEEFCKGQLVFLNGVRAAVREAGLDVKEFEFMHVYLSNHVHSHPVSLLRQENVSFETPTAFQLSFCRLCLEGANVYLSAANARIETFTGSIKLDPNGHMD